MSFAASLVKRFAASVGIDLRRIGSVNHSETRRKLLLRHHEVDLVFDVGANIGQYAALLRKTGFRGRIISFEPLPQAYRRLAAHARGDSGWETYNFALGDEPGVATINVSENLVSSSLLEPSDSLFAAAPMTRIIGQQKVRVERMDRILRDMRGSARRIFLKIDAQGFESRILLSGGEDIQFVHGLELELALIPSYKGQPILHDMLSLTAGLGFHVASLDPGLADPRTGELRECDAILFRNVG